MPISTSTSAHEPQSKVFTVKLRLLAVILLLSGVSLSGIAQTTSQIDSAMWIYSACANGCPAYSVRIHRDGLVQYNGTAAVKVYGPKTWSIPERTAESLLRRLEAGQFLAGERAGRFLTDQGDCANKTDEKSVSIVIEANGRDEMPIATCYNSDLEKVTADAATAARADIFATGHDPECEAAIRAVLDAQVAAWNKEDVDAFMRGYWMSKDLTFFSGATETQGWTETLERYRKSYKSTGKQMGKLTFGELRTEMLSPESAFVRGTWKLVMPDGKTPHGLFTLIFRKMPDGWRIIHDSTGGS